MMGSEVSGNRCLIIGTQAAGAQFKPLGLTFDNDRGLVNIRHPASLGMALGVADIISVKRSLTANLALQF